jgi:hypothetical protein
MAMRSAHCMPSGSTALLHSIWITRRWGLWQRVLLPPFNKPYRLAGLFYAKITLLYFLTFVTFINTNVAQLTVQIKRI